jgi:Peptidase family M28
MNLIETLGSDIGPRLAGTAASGRAADAAAGAFRELGLEPYLQEFPFLAYEPDEPLLEIDGEPWAAGPVMYGQKADVVGTLRRIGTHVVLPQIFEPPAFAIETDGREVARIYVNPLGGGATPFPTGYGPVLTGPGAYVSSADGERLTEGARVRLRVGGRLVPTTERNVGAVLDGETPATVVVCAHYDSAWRASGAVDNASGVEGMRRIVERLARSRHRRTLHALAFGAEELGLSGSRFFVADAKTRSRFGDIEAVVNLECLGRGERLEVWASDELLRRAVRLAGDLAPTTRPALPGSDHFPFAQEHVPAACILRWPFPEYHLPSDAPRIVDERLLEEGVELAAALVEELLDGDQVSESP